MPQTFVMGHMLVVAILSYFCVLELDEPCDQRLVNSFLGGLFHDLPEVLTRDIVSPVKNSVKGLDSIINEIEQEQVREIIFPLLPPSWHDEINYYLKDEFSSKIVLDGKTKIVTSEVISELYNDAHFNPIDGEIIRGCDHLSAYYEAYMSLNYGIRSEQMQGGYDHLRDKYQNKKIDKVDFSTMFKYFEL